MDRWSPRGSGVSCGKSRRLLVGGGTAPAHRSSQSRGGQRPVELERAQVVLRAWHTVPPPASVPATVPVLHSSTMPTLRQLVGGLQHPAALPRAWYPLQGLHFVPGPAHAQHDKWTGACSTQSPCPNARSSPRITQPHHVSLTTASSTGHPCPAHSSPSAHKGPGAQLKTAGEEPPASP